MSSDRPQLDDQAPPTRFWQKISLVAEISARCRQPNPDGSTMVEILRLIQGIIPFDGATLYLYEEHTGCFKPHACLGERVEPSGPIIALDGLISDAERLPCREPVLLSCDDNPDVFGPDSPYAAIMSVPLLVEDKVIGVLDLGSWYRGCLEEKHLQLMAIVADQVAVSLERLNYIAMIETKNRELQLAHERLKAMQKQIIAAEKLTAMAELAASINHSINNPLAVILGHAQLLQVELPTSSEKAQTRLRLIEEAATRIGKINRKVLKIDSIVAEEYVEGAGGKILNLDKSTVD